MILLTGGTGFIGRALLDELVSRNFDVLAAIRPSSGSLPDYIKQFCFENLDSRTDWSEALNNVEVVIHSAAQAHDTVSSVEDVLSRFREINVEGSLNLARQASGASVKRFVFLSSIKVNGELTDPGKCFTAEDEPNPSGPYAISKAEAEIALRELASETGMEVVIIRPPLVYGPAVKANFLSLLRWVNAGAPLPLGAIHNSRSLVALDNLVDLVITCILHQGAANQTFLVGDGEDLSTTELLQRIGKALGKPARLIPVPVSLLTFAAFLLGKKAVAQRLCNSLQVDISKTRAVLDWEPPVSVDEGLRQAVDNIKKQSGAGGV